MNTNKLCPLFYAEDCKKEKCAFWIMSYTTEGLIFSNCAIVIMALKTNSRRVEA